MGPLWRHGAWQTDQSEDEFPHGKSYDAKSVLFVAEGARRRRALQRRKLDLVAATMLEVLLASNQASTTSAQRPS